MFEDQVCTRTKNYLVSIGNVFFFFGALQYTTLSPSTFVLTLFACETMNSCRKQFGKKESSFSTLDFVIWSGFCLNFSTLPEECLLAKPVAQLRVLAQECQYLLAISSFFWHFCCCCLCCCCCFYCCCFVIPPRVWPLFTVDYSQRQQ